MKVVPILVGSVSAENEAMYGELLAKYVDDPKNFFSVSSDFCHWGSRFFLTLRLFISFEKPHSDETLLLMDICSRNDIFCLSLSEIFFNCITRFSEPFQ